MSTVFSPQGYLRLPRWTALACSPDGSRLVGVCQELDANGSRFVPALWDLDVLGRAPAVRLTRSAEGDSQPAIGPDGSLVFVSARARADSRDPSAALWSLPRTGEAVLTATAPAGLAAPTIARRCGTTLVLAHRTEGATTAEDDRAARLDRTTRRLSGVVHTSYPIRHWDRDLGPDWPHLFMVTDHGLRDLTPTAREELLDARVSVSADGRTAATVWRHRSYRGQLGYALAIIDIDSAAVTLLDRDGGNYYSFPAISPDGTRIAAVREHEGDHATPRSYELVVWEIGTASVTQIPTGDFYPVEVVWAGNGSRFVVAGSRYGHGAVITVESDSWKITELTDDAALVSVCVDELGQSIYAIRTDVGRLPHPVRLDLDGTITDIPVPGQPPQLPGTVTELVAVAPDGGRVHSWLCLPDQASPDSPVPLQVWIHGGPFGSWNSWSWRWCPWVAVERGYAVLLPDPALSIGYGPQWFARAWPHRAAPIWADLQASMAVVQQRPDIDGERVACLGTSFGGYIANWIAGHTDVFRAIVSHAGLWALDQQHTTTDSAYWKDRLFGTPGENPGWFAENSPHHHVAGIRTPVLISHGNRDYRVPVTEAVRMWWDLVRAFDGPPDELPHRFLQFPDEAHWIAGPANIELWYTTVLDFVDRHIAAIRPKPPDSSTG